MKKILFYLPNVTPWWFDHVIAPLIHLVAAEHEVHVMVPPLWQGTGIGGHQLRRFGEMPEISWHIVDGENHPALRDGITGHDDVVAFVRDIDPDYVLCRCADPEVIRQFPGTVRYIMEGVAPPVRTDSRAVIFTDELFEFGAMPELDAADAKRLDAAFAEIWPLFDRHVERGPAPSWREQAGVAPDRKVIALPLEYEFEDTFTGPHRAYRDNCGWIEEMAARIDDDIFLAITNHPLNDLYVDQGPVKAAVAALGDRAAIVRFDDKDTNATEAVAADCDGAILELSKSYLVYAHGGVPIARPAAFRTAAWLNAEADVGTFSGAVRAGEARPAAPDATRRWFAHHFANNVVHLRNRDLDAGEILDRLDRPTDPDRWERNIARFDQLLRKRTNA